MTYLGPPAAGRGGAPPSRGGAYPGRGAVPGRGGPTPPRFTVATLPAWLRARRWRWITLLVLVALVVVYPFAGGAIAARIAADKLRSRLATPVRIGGARAGLFGLTFRDVHIGPEVAGSAQKPLATVALVRIPFAAALLRRGTIDVDGLVMNVRRGGADDNVTATLTALRHRPATAPAPGPSSGRLPAVALKDARLTFHDAASGLAVEVARIGCLLVPGEKLDVQLGKVDGVLALGSTGKGPRFGAESLTITGPLDGLRPRGYPTLGVTGGFATPLPTLSLTGIHGQIHPAAAQKHDKNGDQTGDKNGEAAASKQLVIDLDGSYGGARETLWTARGGVDPAAHEGQVSLRAERFSLGEIVDVLPKSVLSPKNTNVNAAFDISWAEGAVRFGGDMRVAGLSVEHPGVASEPVTGLNLGLIVRGTAFPSSRRVALDRLEGRVGELAGKLSGFIELAPGTFTFADGSKLGFLPRMELTLEVPKLPCAKALGSLPPPVVPHLQGFTMQGVFGAEITARVDYADLEALELKGKVGIDGCKVLKVPPEIKALVAGDSFPQTVEVPKLPGPRGAGAGETEEMEFIIGPENSDFVPYDQISPNLIGSIMTTEDNGFFKHRGWVTSEFRAALKRNLQRGGFRGGASSISMQMVKNVLLSQEKTLSRKLQELFLVWYLEQEIPKERILELYFNAIEFGPRLYGIGAASRHYFGKPPAELTPLEGAFFSSILPSPKRRYVQYCHGALTNQWEKYVHRILAKVHERGRITDEAYQEVAGEKLVFDRSEATLNERQCLDWVKKMTARPEPETPPDLDAQLDGDAPDDSGPLPVGKLRRLFSKAAKHTPPAKPTRAD